MRIVSATGLRLLTTTSYSTAHDRSIYDAPVLEARLLGPLKRSPLAILDVVACKDYHRKSTSMIRFGVTQNFPIIIR
jgi:hypothetical protein